MFGDQCVLGMVCAEELQPNSAFLEEPKFLEWFCSAMWVPWCEGVGVWVHGSNY